MVNKIYLGSKFTKRRVLLILYMTPFGPFQKEFYYEDEVVVISCNPFRWRNLVHTDIDDKRIYIVIY